MRFIHLSDLHIGRQLHQYNLKEDQEHILGEVVEYARMLKPDAIVIAGDVCMISLYHLLRRWGFLTGF